MVARELDDEPAVADQFKRLRLRGGVLLSADLGPGNKHANYVLRTAIGRRRGLRERIGVGPAFRRFASI